MQTKEFLEQVWSDQPYYCVVSKDQQDNVVPIFVETIDQAIKHANAFVKENLDSYFACSTWTEKTDRKAINAKEQKIFWLDIDCGYDQKHRKYKDYKTKEDAMVALRNFIEVTKLPDPTIVDSGNGLHCYWPFTDPIATAIWKPIALGLKFLCVKHGFKSDANCTADVSRILRVPGTKNFKNLEDVKSVSILQKGAPTSFDDLAALIPAEIVSKANRPKRPIDEATKAILGNHASKFRKIIERCKIDDGCDQLEHIITKQKEIAEPLWRSGLSIAAHCEDRDIAIHKMSRFHNDYEFETTEKKANAIPAPHTCKQFEAQRPEGCKKCKHKGTITSPIQLGRVVARARGADNVVETMSEALDAMVTYKIPDYPFPYFRGKNGGIYRSMPDDEDDGIKIYDYDFYLVERLHDTEYGETAWFKLHLPQDGVREFVAATSDLLAKDRAKDILIKNGIIVYGKQMDQIIEYISVCIQVRQHTNKTVDISKQYGWNKQLSKILIGNREITAFGIKYVPVSQGLTTSTNPPLHKAGSYDLWKHAISAYERPGMELKAFAFFAAFGSLLMPFLRETSAVINLYNPISGQGKTTILQAITSVYGDPKLESKLVNVWGDTDNSIINRAGYHNHLALTVDEMTGVSPDELHNFLKFLATCRGKNRMSSNGKNEERVNDTTFKLICVTSSNTDFRTVAFAKKALASGDIARVLQLQINPDDGLTKTEADSHFELLQDNYGHAGEEFAQHLVANVDTLRKQVKELQVKIDNELNIQGKDRKYSATLAAIFLGAIIARRLKIHNIEIKPVYKAVAKALFDTSEVVKERDFDSIQTLGDFLLENKGSTLVINNANDARTSFAQEAPILKPMYELKIRIEPDTNTIFIPTSVMREYLDKKGVEVDDFIKGLKEANVLKERSKLKNLHKGLEISAPNVRCICIDNSTFDDIKIENLPLDIPKNVN
jgi:hypothetical protein